MITYEKAGHYFPGVPARDLSNNEYLDLSEEQRTQIIESGVYKMVGRPPTKRTDEPVESEIAQAVETAMVETATTPADFPPGVVVATDTDETANRGIVSDVEARPRKRAAKEE